MAKFFFINLDRVPERAAFMEQQFDSVGLADSAERYSAVDAAKAGELTNTKYRSGGWRPRWSMSKTEVACFESHRRLWLKIVDEGLSFAFILEDDVFLSTRFSEAVKATEHASTEIDVIKIDGAVAIARYGVLSKVGDFQLRPILHPVQSAAGYRISFNGAFRLLDLSSQYSDTVDDFIFQPRDNWRAAQLFPAVAVQGMFTENNSMVKQSSLIMHSERTADPNLNVDTYKGPPAYRISKELKRYVRKTKRKLWKDKMLVRKGGFIGQPPLAEDLGRYLFVA